LERSTGDDRRAVVVNFTTDDVTLALPGEWIIEVSSSDPDGEGRVYRGRLAPDEALILRPA
jgi:hypothetical protein